MNFTQFVMKIEHFFENFGKKKITRLFAKILSDLLLKIFLKLFKVKIRDFFEILSIIEFITFS